MSGATSSWLHSTRSSLAFSDPVTYGEELFDLRVMKVTVKIAVRYPVMVEFAVYPDRRQVFVRTLRYLGPD